MADLFLEFPKISLLMLAERPRVREAFHGVGARRAGRATRLVFAKAAPNDRIKEAITHFWEDCGRRCNLVAPMRVPSVSEAELARMRTEEALQ